MLQVQLLKKKKEKKRKGKKSEAQPELWAPQHKGKQVPRSLEEAR